MRRSDTALHFYTNIWKNSGWVDKIKTDCLNEQHKSLAAIWLTGDLFSDNDMDDVVFEPVSSFLLKFDRLELNPRHYGSKIQVIYYRPRKEYIDLCPYGQGAKDNFFSSSSSFSKKKGIGYIVSPLCVFRPDKFSFGLVYFWNQVYISIATRVHVARLLPGTASLGGKTESWLTMVANSDVSYWFLTTLSSHSFSTSSSSFCHACHA